MGYGKYGNWTHDDWARYLRAVPGDDLPGYILHAQEDWQRSAAEREVVRRHVAEKRAARAHDRLETILEDLGI